VIDYEALLARSTDVISVVDADGAIGYLSPSAERILGYEPEELCGGAFVSRVHPSDRDAVRRIFTTQESIGTERDPVEHRFRHADGSWVWLETRRAAEYDDDVEGYVTTSRDITRRKRTEREREQLLDRMGDGFLGIDDDWRVTYLNDEAERLLDTSAAALVGEDIRESLDWAESSVFHDQYREAMATQEPVSFESHVEPLDAVIEVRVFPSTTGLSVYFRDVTQARRIKRELERAVETLHGLYEIASATDMTLDEKQYRLLETGRRHLDLPYAFVTRMTDGKQVIVDAVGDHAALQPGSSCPIEESYCRKTVETDGLLAIQDAAEGSWHDDPAFERFELGSYIGGRIEVDGDLYGTLCFAATDPRARAFTDSERSFVELASRWLAYEFEEAQYQRRLERQNERLDNFASILSHDLRNPLNVVKGRLELVDSGDEHLDAAVTALDRAFDLIDDVLAFSRAGGDVLDPERIALPAVAERAWAIVDPTDATLDIAPDAGTVTADETRLQQLLENLFRNSVEHGSTDSRVESGDSVEHGSTENRRGSAGDSVEHTPGGVTVSIGRLDDAEGFFVADDGPGIPPDRRERVFELGHTDAEDGSGLGLAIVREIADAHGWAVHVTESEAGGARFDVDVDGAGVELPE